ncbi:DUF2304 domain-containing protein [Adlercreutzia sp. R21]|uniref:DUF2304 domain-containing protein n=1 Tax=Adlercreutzia wanghongyangiae TaxID=3111451 RepID=UPI002DC02E5F|nr:DUF2304 domain-containing protein [Adlercreutzia sp. R21]MEC4185371.1 DUF2304 domain-containing protein [Adlercreutzia sp. R21]
MYWVALVLGAIFTLVYVVLKIRSNQMSTADAVFWFVLSFCMVVMALVPGVAFFFSDTLGFLSTANFIFLCILAVLMYHQLSMSVKVARLQNKLSQLTQAIALSQVQAKRGDADSALDSTAANDGCRE